MQGSDAASRLSLAGTTLAGPLPELPPGVLPSLRRLHLAFNAFTTTLPLSWGGDPAVLPALQELSLQLLLTSLNLPFNDITGTLPAELLARHPKLRELRLDGNRFTSTLPDAWRPLRSSACCWQATRSDGTLPAGLAWSKLSTLTLDGTAVADSVPEAWCHAVFGQHLTTFTLEGTRVAPTLPGRPIHCFPLLDRNVWGGAAAPLAIGGRFGAVCSNGFRFAEAQVACRSMSLAGGAPAATFPAGRVPVVMCMPRGLPVGIVCNNPPIAYARLAGSEYDSYTRAPGSIVRGRLEVAVQGLFGTVCADKFGAEEAQAVCKMMGFSGGLVLPKGSFVDQTKPIAMNGVACRPSATSLNSCSYTIQPRCPPKNSVAIECTRPSALPVRLQGGSTLAGRVEVQIGQRWGTICGPVGTAAAQVICGSLGLRGGAPMYRNTKPAPWLPILMSGLKCSGEESTLSMCSFSTSAKGCRHERDAAVRCKPPAVQSVMLINEMSPYPNEGFVFAGSANFGEEEARVVCSEMGMAGGAVIGADKRPFPVVQNVRCKGTESRLSDCTYEVTGTCKGNRAVVVACEESTIGRARLVGSKTPGRGRLEVLVGGKWGSVCNLQDMTSDEARVACRQLGFKWGTILGSRFGGKPAPFRVGQLSCLGNETRLSAPSCNYNTAGQSVTECQVECYNCPDAYSQTGVPLALACRK
ncbi:deleted in malignant brain tumors 1 -like [Micractinium conductrix]|uniref:Deleted in malignant brain tumors 1 -like n=1 Tax=Micractinium conductrix TaxID=554055 RepID=A0A2P6VEP9_9CHLO|nr:deleted in malignant brain tumors 1 -like [Micractinium conductrix]|eukprot:PSC72551.1 deleted in malignant brain tumors 1 -like [Micractinium conductrix]